MCEVTPDLRERIPYSMHAPSQARRLVEGALCRAHARDAEAAVTLLASELVADVMLHGEPPLTLSMECRGGDVCLLVEDGAQAPPQVQSAHRDLTLLLVGKVAREWGIEATDEGTVRWCVVPTGVVPPDRRRKVAHGGPSDRDGHLANRTRVRL